MRTVPPWPTTVAAFLSIAILAVGSGPSPALLLPIVGLLAVYVVPARVERATRAVWLARLLLFVLGLTLNAGHQTQLMDAWGPAPNLDALAVVCGAEMTLRAWHRPTNSRQMLLLSGLIVLVGCCTPDERVGVYLVPAYFAFVILSLRADRAHSPEAGQTAPRLLRGLAILLVLSVGAGAQWGFRVYRDQIMAWGSSVLDAKPPVRDASQVSGIAKDPTLGPTFGSPGSSARILRIVGGLPDPHLHGMAFDTYDRGSWRPPLTARLFVPVPAADLRPGAPGPRATITRFVNDDGMVSAPPAVVDMDLPFADEATCAPQEGGPLRLESGAPLTYRLTFGPGEALQGPWGAPPDARELARCRVVPSELDPRVRALAQRIAGRLPTPQARAEAIQDYLLTHNAYSLRTHPGPGDPVSDFVLHHKSAHCEFFASAAVLLLRCAGVPARYAIGYYAHESDGPHVTVVRGQDAHAWAEAWMEGVGWVVVDATPGNGRPDHTARTPAWWKWRDRWQDLTLALQTAFARLSAVRRLLLLAALVLVLLVPSLFRAWRRRRTSAPAVFTYAAPPPDLADLAARFEDWLAQQGVPCPPERPWAEHVGRMESALGNEGGSGSKEGRGGPAPTPEATLVGAGPPRPSSPPLPLSSPAPLPATGRGLPEAFIAAYNRARFGEDPHALTHAADALRRLEET